MLGVTLGAAACAALIFGVGMLGDRVDSAAGADYDPLYPANSWQSLLFFGGMGLMFFALFFVCFATLGGYW